MRIYRGSDADIVLRPFMVRLSEIVSFDLQLWTSGTYTVKRSTSESGMTTDKVNNLINVHFTDKETGYLDAGVLNAKLMYRITDSEYPDGTYDGIITIPQEYYLMTPPDFSGATIEKVYESGYTEGYNSAIQNSVLSINGEKGDLKLKTVNGNELLGEGNINIKALKYFELTQERAREAYDEIQNHWDDKSGYTGDFIFYYKKENRSVYTFDEVGAIKDHSVYFNYLNNADAYDMNGNVKCFAIIIWKDGYRLQTYENDFAIPTKTSQLTNDSAFQTKSEVDTAIENAISGGGSGIVLDNLTQEERKAVYDKLDKTKNPDEVFFYNNTASVSAFWDGSKYLKFITIGEYYKGLKTTMYSLAPNGSLDEEDWGMRYTNTLTIFLRNHVNETDPFECEYNGSFYEYLVRPYTRPNAYFIWFWKGYGASTKPVYVPFSVEWDKYYDTEGEGPITIQFTIDGITYKYRNDLTNENTWQYDGKISIYDSHSINGFNGTSLVLGDAALDATDKNKYVDMRAMMGHDTIFDGDNDGSCPYLTIITTDNQMYKVPVWVKCNKQNDSTTRATFEFDLNGYHYLYTQDNQGDLTYSFTSKTPIGGGTSVDVPTKVSQLENDANYATQSEIPTKVSQLENDAKYATQSELPKTTSELTNNSGFITIEDVPTKVSQLENDRKYISNSNTDGGVSKMWTGTQAEYDAIDPKDNSTIYIVDGKYIYWQGQVIGGGGGTGVAGVSSVNGKTGDVKLKTINNIDLTNSIDILPNIRIVQPFWKEAGFKCGLNFNFKIDESGNETIKSVQPSGFQKIDVGGIVKNRFFQYFQGGDSPHYAQIGLYQAVFTTDAGDSGAHPSQLTYGTINTWGNTHIDNTEDPESEDYFGYYVSFTVISPYTFTKYDVTVLSYYVTAEIENTNTWKIICKKAN